MNPEQKPEPKIENQPIRALRTYQGDVEQALSKNKSSAITVMVAEQKRREERPDLAPPKISTEVKNRTFFALGSVLLVLGILVVGGVYYYIKSTGETPIEQPNKSLVIFSKETNLVTTSGREQYVQKINSEKNAFKLTTNSILYLKVVDGSGNTVNSEDFLKILANKIPSDLARSFDKEFMLGIYSFDTNEPFIILKTSDYPSSFAGMLKWEKEMVRDIGDVFSINENLRDVAFIDEELKNKDLRILKDTDNKTVLVYSFIDKNTLIITSNENIFTAVLGKYIISQQAR